MKLLLIEDEKAFSDLLKETLLKERYIVETARDFRSAMDKINSYNYDCIILDICLPDGNGLDILKHLKSEKKSDNIIIISARDSLDDKLSGLNLGADDYLTKPFHIAELNARIRAVMRRNSDDNSHLLKFGNLVMDIENRQVSVGGNLVPLNRKEFDILNYFLFNKTRLVTKSALAEHIWGGEMDQSDNLDFIYYQIKNLRKKLADYEAKIEIEAVYGVGYRISEP